MPQKNDPINKPVHYTSSSSIECIDAIKAALSTEQFEGWLRGNVIKYLWRYPHKNKLEDLHTNKINELHKEKNELQEKINMSKDIDSDNTKYTTKKPNLPPLDLKLCETYEDTNDISHYMINYNNDFKKCDIPNNSNQMYKYIIKYQFYIDKNKFSWFELKNCPRSLYFSENMQFKLLDKLNFKQEIKPIYYTVTELLGSKKFFDDKHLYVFEKLIKFKPLFVICFGY